MRKSPMIARVSGPTTTTRRLVMAPMKSAPPQRLDQPIPTRTAARAAIEHAGRYTRDDSATSAPFAVRPFGSAGARSVGAGAGAGERRGAGAWERPGATMTDMTTSQALTRALEPSAPGSATRRTGAGRARARAGRLGCHHREPRAPCVRQVVAGHFPGTRVSDKVVEGFSAIRDLEDSARALHRAEFGRSDTGSSGRLRHSLGQHHLGPDRDARAGAGRVVLLQG